MDERARTSSSFSGHPPLPPPPPPTPPSPPSSSLSPADDDDLGDAVTGGGGGGNTSTTTTTAATTSSQNSPGHVSHILDITDDEYIITNVIQGELVMVDESIVEATDVVRLDDNFDHQWITFRDKLRLSCLVILGVAGLAIALGIGLKAGSPQPKCHFSSTWIREGPDITHAIVDSKTTKKAWCGYTDRVVSRSFGSSVSLSNTGNRIAVSGRFAYDGVSVYEFEPTNSSWIILGEDIIFGGSAHIKEQFDFRKGVTTAVLSGDGNRLAISEPLHSSDGLNRRGQVRVYKYSGESWALVGKEILGTRNMEFLGSHHSVDISEDGRIVAMGDPHHNDETGRVKVFKDVSGNWTRLGDDVYGEFRGEQFSNSVSLSADGMVLAAGAWYHKNSTGSVRIFQYSGDNWTQIGDTLVGESGYHQFGFSLSISANGTRIAVSSATFAVVRWNCTYEVPKHPLDDATYYQESVKVFEYDTGNWTQLGQKINPGKNRTEFGYSISLSGDGSTLAVGSPGYQHNDTIVGLLQTYRYACGNWTPVGKEIEGNRPNAWLGNSVSMSYNGEKLAVGTPPNYLFLSDPGTATVYSNISTCTL